LTQKEAAEYLGVAPRTVQRYAERGILHCTYEPGPTGGHRPVYDREEVEKFKEQIGTTAPGQSVGRPAGQSGRPGGGMTIEELALILGTVVTRAQPAAPQIALTDKLTLTLAEAAELSGLARGFLREAIRSRKLKGIRGAGRGFRIKRSDLETFVRGLV